MSILKVVKIALIAAIYITLTVFLAPISYGEIQFRFAEILVLLCFYRKEYCYSLIIGCMVANFFSPFGYMDVLFGTLHTTISVILISRSKKLVIASLYPTLLMFIIGFEIAILSPNAFWPTFFSVTLTAMLGEFVVVSIFGVAVFHLLNKHTAFRKWIGEEERYEKDEI
ncbi:MAG: QueT transporter family protein [Bacilli bacterium]|jgi:uncharacterized membrane protein|nr:QueT transporter family protein [Bacilli bacterium]MDY0063837.1 QueT transporter family protein [Bacilli bacterium]